MLTLMPAKPRFVVIDLQEGILPFAGGPHSAGRLLSAAPRVWQKNAVPAVPL